MRKGEDNSLLGEEEDLRAFKRSQRIVSTSVVETEEQGTN